MHLFGRSKKKEAAAESEKPHNAIAELKEKKSMLEKRKEVMEHKANQVRRGLAQRATSAPCGAASRSCRGVCVQKVPGGVPAHRTRKKGCACSRQRALTHSVREQEKAKALELMKTKTEKNKKAAVLHMKRKVCLCVRAYVG